MIDLLDTLIDELPENRSLQRRLREQRAAIVLRNLDGGSYSAEELECMGFDGLALLAGGDA